VFGVSRDQANLLTAVLLLGAAEGAYEATRRITGTRLHVSGTDAALGAIAEVQRSRLCARQAMTVQAALAVNLPDGKCARA
jgi:hypothetical protein